MDKETLLKLLRGNSIKGDEEERTIAHRIEDMAEKDIKEVVIEFVYSLHM